MFKGVQVAVEEEVDGYCDRLSPVSIRSLRSLRKKSLAIMWKSLSSDRRDNDQ